jgi:hypothetical protein
MPVEFPSSLTPFQNKSKMGNWSSPYHHPMNLTANMLFQERISLIFLWLWGTRSICTTRREYKA